MPKIYVLIFVVVFTLTAGNASGFARGLGARPAGMSGAVTAVYGFWSLNNNQAGITLIEHPSLAVYTENRYMIAGTSTITAASVIPAWEGAIGISLNYHGNSLYNENLAGLAYARRFGERLSAGVRLNYIHIRIGQPGYVKGRVVAEAGIIYEVFPGFFTGVHIFNPARAILARQHVPMTDQRISTVFRKGVSYAFSRQLLVSLDAEKNIEHPLSLRFGLEYRISDEFTARAGLSSNPVQNSIGAGYSTGNWQFDIAASYHHILGHSPQAGIIYSVK